MFKCENPECGKEHDGSYGSGRFCSDHCRRSFAGKQNKKYATKDQLKMRKGFGKTKALYGTWKCKHCQQIFETKRALYDHYHKSHNLINFKRGGWSKGLTKETNTSLKRVSEKLKGHTYNKGIQHKTKHTLEYRQKMSRLKKEFYALHPEKHPARLLANNRSHMTYAEKLAFDWLTENKIEFQHHYHFKSIEINRYVDFYIPSKSMFIEIDGEFWHKDRKELDKKKDIDAINNGFITVRIPAKSNIIEKLKEIFCK